MKREFRSIKDVRPHRGAAETAAAFDQTARLHGNCGIHGSGNVDLEMKYPTGNRKFNYTKGLALSFFADESVDCIHTVSKEHPLECIVIATATRNLKNLPNQEGEQCTKKNIPRRNIESILLKVN